MIADLPYARSRTCLHAVPLITAVARTTAIARTTAVAIVTMVQGLAAAGKVGLVVAAEPVPVIAALAAARGLALVDPRRGGDPAWLTVKFFRSPARATARPRMA
ncbi:MAG TPA: hypothetical protein VF940_11550 [Streptosporangiaceae bacterium]